MLLLFLANPLALGFARIDSGSHQELCRLQIRFIVVLCYPFKKSTKVYFVTSLLLARNFLLAFTVQFSRCRRRRSKVHSVRNILSDIPHFIPLLLLFLANPLALGFARIDSGSHQELCRLQIRFIVVLCYPFKKSTKVYFVTSLLLARNFLLAFTVQFSRCRPLILLQDQIEMLGRLPKHFNLFLVEVTGLEPVTPCLQSKCSTS